LFPSCGRGGTDSEKTLFAALDAGEDMGKGLGAYVADRCHVGVGGENEWVWKVHVEGLGVDTLDSGLDCVFWGLLAEEGEDFFAFLAEWEVWLLVS
jgi:hypothetical protein